MPNFLTTFLLLVISLTIIIVGIGEFVCHGQDVDMDSQYLDEDGDHIYYDRSLIEKKLFRRRFPHITDIRSFSRLFRGE